MTGSKTNTSSAVINRQLHIESIIELLYYFREYYEEEIVFEKAADHLFGVFNFDDCGNTIKLNFKNRNDWKKQDIADVYKVIQLCCNYKPIEECFKYDKFNR